ncbi:hypothetical protein [Capnocytophaga sp.]
MKNTSLKLLVLALVGLFLTNCQRDDAPEVLPQEEPVPAVDPQAVVSLDEAKSLFEASENQKRMTNSVSRSNYPLIELETNWQYFEQMQTLTGDAYAKVSVRISRTELNGEVLFLKKDGKTKQYLFFTKADSIAADRRIINANFYLFDTKGVFLSACQMRNGVITHKLVPKRKGSYRIIDNNGGSTTGRSGMPICGTCTLPFSDNFFYYWEDPHGGEEEKSGGRNCIELEPITVTGIGGGNKKNNRNPNFPNYPYYDYLPINNWEENYDRRHEEDDDIWAKRRKFQNSSNIGAGMAKEEEKKEEAPVIYRPDHPISDNKCFFSTVDLNKGATLTIYVDEPNPGTGDVKKGINVGHTFIGITQGQNQYTYGFYPNVPGYKTLANDNVGSVLGKDNEHIFSVSISAEVTPEQLQKIIELSQKSYTRQYNLSYSNCTDFAISVANLANITLPYCKGTWTGGGGSAPGVLGKALRDSSTFKNKINTDGGKAPASKGNGC